MSLDKFGRRGFVDKESTNEISLIKQIETELINSNSHTTELWLQVTLLQETVTKLTEKDFNAINVNLGMLQTQFILLNDSLNDLKTKHEQDIKRFAVKLFNWLKKVHLKKKISTNIDGSNFIAWDEIFKAGQQ